MNGPALAASTGHVRIDDAVRATIDVTEQQFPQRVRAYYLLGSYAAGVALPASDVDLAVVFKGPLPDEAERRHARSLADELSRAHGEEIKDAVQALTRGDDEGLRQAAAVTLARL